MPVTIDADPPVFDGGHFSQFMWFAISGDIDSDAIRQVFSDAQDAFRASIEAAALAEFAWPPKRIEARPLTWSGGSVDWSSGAFFLSTTWTMRLATTG